MRYLVIQFLILICSILSFGQTPKQGEIATLQDCNLYYEIYGEGDPLFFLHGFFGSSKHWNSYIEEYADEFEVYLVDLTGHGKSSNFKDRISIPEAAHNLFKLIQSYGLEKINIIGFSYGADVAFHLAATYPGTVSSMITIGGIGSWDVNDFPDWIEYFSYENIDNIKWIRNHQADETQVKWLLENFSSYTPFLGDEEYSRIQAKTLMIFGDNDDSISLAEIERVRNSMPSTDLWILPNTGHDAHMGRSKELFIKTSKEFLNNK